MSPPPAEPLASRIFLGPALRTQPDRRLVKLVREGYEGAFEEIVRRYRKPLDRFAAAIVGGHAEDVTQDAFSKALLALRGSEAEIELRPWLYRIVRNAALNDLRDAPPPTEELGEAVAGGRSAAVEAERREELAELVERLRALPEPQRAAIVMRELEGLSHEEIAAALGVSGGAARQAIHRARVALRDGFGLLVPLPLLRLLFDHGAEAATAGGAAAAAGAVSAAGGGGATLGGLGAGGALKAGMATALVAGSVGAGVAIESNGDGPRPQAATASAEPTPGRGGDSDVESNSSGPDSGSGSDRSEDRDSSGPGGGEPGGDDSRGPGGPLAEEDASSGEDSRGRGRGRGRGGDDRAEDRHRGSSRSGPSAEEELDEDRSGDGTSGGSGDGTSGGSNSGPAATSLAAPAPEPVDDDDSGSGSSGGDSDFEDTADSSGSGSGED